MPRSNFQLKYLPANYQEAVDLAYIQIQETHNQEVIQNILNNVMLTYPIPIYYDQLRYSRRNNRFYYETTVWNWYHVKMLYEPHWDQTPCAVAIGPIIQNTPSIVNYRSVNNHLRGLSKRLVAPQHFDRDYMRRFKKFVRKYVKTHYQPLDKIVLDHNNLDSLWLDDAHHYTLKQKQRFHDLLDEYILKGHNMNKYRYRYECNSFIKRELTTEMKEPRIINSRSDLFKVLIAIYIKEIERIITHDNSHFVKGKLPQEVAQRLKQITDQHGICYETDYSSFEGSFTPEVKRYCEYTLFKHMLKNNPQALAELRPLYELQFVERLHFMTSKHLDYTATFRGSRMSGDMWTSLGNGFTNMMLFLFAIKKLQDNSSDVLNYDYVFEGDDGFFSLNKDVDIDHFIDNARKLGFKLKILKASSFSDVSFCGIKLAPSGLFLPDVISTLTKFGYTSEPFIVRQITKNNTTHHFQYRLKQYIRAKALSLLSLSEGVPILQAIAAKGLQLTEGVQLNPRDFDWWYTEVFNIHNYKPQIRPIREEDRYYFYDKYNIEPVKQRYFESIIENSLTYKVFMNIRIC